MNNTKNRLNKEEKTIIYWFVGALLIPPVSWLLSAWYFHVWNTEEMLKILLRPNIPGYVIIVATILFFIVRNKVQLITKYKENPNPENLINAQKSIAFIPRFFMIILPIYTTAGDFPVLGPLEFIDIVEFILGIVIGVPIVFLFAIPFFIMMSQKLELYANDVPISEKYKSVSISQKMMVVFLLSVIGVSVIFVSAAMGILHNYQGDNLMMEFLEIFLVTTAIVLALTFLNFSLFKSEVLGSINKIKNQMKAIAEGSGNLTQRIELTTHDELGEVSYWFNKFIQNINEIIIEVSSAISSVNKISKAISNISVQISESSNKHAASTEEVASIMEEMSANTEQNTDRARKTEKTAFIAKGHIEESQKTSEQSLDAMFQISKKIEIINSIAKKTDILAINASIEAARAGQEGLGFAVVASEIRKLAEISQGSAQSINELAETSLQLVENSAIKLKEVVPAVEETANLNEEISSASIQQKISIDEANITIQELNVLGQENAATANTLSSAFEELKNQNKRLIDIISVFKTKN